MQSTQTIDIGSCWIPNPKIFSQAEIGEYVIVQNVEKFKNTTIVSYVWKSNDHGAICTTSSAGFERLFILMSTAGQVLYKV